MNQTYRESFFGMSISEALNVIKDKPSQGNDHQNHKGDGNKHHRGLANIGRTCGIWTGGFFLQRSL